MAKKAKKVVRKAVKKMPVLPRKMSSLIGIALKDIRKAEKQSEKFVIDMNTWYQPNSPLVCRLGDNDFAKVISRKEVCVMCAAGSVLAFSLGGKGQPLSGATSALEKKNETQLGAIDNLRQGQVNGAASYLGLFDSLTDDEHEELSVKTDKLDTDIPDYDIANPEPFHKAMKALQAKLVKAGL